MSDGGHGRALAAGAALVLAANALTLGAVAWDRMNGPWERFALTDRELPLPLVREPEDTGVRLLLVTSDEPPRGVAEAARFRRERIERVDHPWFDGAKLRELGFDLDVEPSDPDADESCEWLPRRYAYVVLEYDGPAFSDWIDARARQVETVRREFEEGAKSREDLADARTLLRLDRTARSRLFPVNAGTDLDDLLARYPDRRRQLVLRAVVAASVARPGGGPPVLRGSVERLILDRIHVPREFHSRLAPYLAKVTAEQRFEQMRAQRRVPWPEASPLRYRASLALGRRLEPWLDDVVAAPPVPVGNPGTDVPDEREHDEGGAPPQ